MIMRPNLRPALGGIAVVLAALIALVAAAPTRADSRPRLSTYDSAFMTFSHPTPWKTYVYGATPTPHVTRLLYISTQPAHDPCRRRPSSSTCGWPVDLLRPGGVVVVWENRTFPGWTLASAPGRALRVGGRDARRASRRPGECSEIGADRTIEVAIERPVAGSWTAFTACLRGPGLASKEKQIAALLASTRFHSP
jgi:hypothetical protein